MPIAPDYSTFWTAQNLYTKVAKLLLTRIPYLSNLSYLDDRTTRNFLDLPSWVPDYSSPDTPLPLPTIRKYPHSFACCPRASCPAMVSISRSLILTTVGSPFDRIAAVASPITATLAANDITSWLATCTRVTIPYALNGEDSSEALWRTLIANTVSGAPAPSSLPIRESFKAWAATNLAHTAQRLLTANPAAEPTIWAALAGLLAPFEAAARYLSSASLPDLNTYDMQQAALLPLFRDRFAAERRVAEEACQKAQHIYCLPNLGEVRRMHHGLYRSKRAVGLARDGGARLTFGRDMLAAGDADMFSMVSSEGMVARDELVSGQFDALVRAVGARRALYHTEKGFLVLGPAGAKVGDEIFVLLEAQVPFVLRERGRAGEDGETLREIVGETYLHGFMDGRMAKEVGWALYSSVAIV